MKTRKIFAIFAFIATILPLTAGAQEIKDTLLRANTDTLMKHIRILASSQYEGRMAGSEAYNNAAEYCADVLAGYGVKPYQDGWNEYFEVEYNEIENCTFNTYINDNDTRTRYVLGRDFVCSSMTGRGYIDAPVVFAGYGIDHNTYNEYAHIDAKGKIVLVLSGVPNHLPSKITDSYTTQRDKARVARNHGAIGMVVINISESCRRNEVQHQAYCGKGSHMGTFPLVQVTEEMGSDLLRGEQMSLEAIQVAMQETNKPISFHLLKKFEINVNAHYHANATTCNVIGMLPGKDNVMKNEYIVVGAHLDHVGMQGNTCVFPGADDNASGVAAVLETARLIVNEAPEFNKRSIIFVLFSGGELQHLGSSIFVSNFQPLRKIEAFVNAECIGSGDSIYIQGGKQFPLLWDIASKNDTVSTHALMRSRFSNPKGDAAAFAQIGIPSLVFTHYHGNHYAHVPSDIPENIERAIMTKNVSLMAEVVYELSMGDYQGRSQKSKRVKFDN